MRKPTEVQARVLTTAKFMIVVGGLLATGTLLLFVTAQAQQTSPPSTQSAPSTGQQAPTAKSSTAPAAKGQGAAAAKPVQKPAPKAQSPLKLKTEKDKISYAIGLNVGHNLKRDSVDVDSSILLRGLKDAMAGGKTLLTDDEIKQVMTTLQADVRRKQEEKVQAATEVNKKEGEAFLAANKSKEGVVTLPSGLQYKILKEGDGPKPTATDSVVCNYRGTLLDGTEFDSSYKRGQPATFPVSRVIKGWTEALQLMPVGSRWQLFVPAELAYGLRGAVGGTIGPDATLIFEVELISIENKANEVQPGAAKPN
ncbi:MAG TPA: FKBP-type peptidyl-prolyl cis-trans isomerase [Candidatus Acidoferrum sp.]|jgi:FKBP-type peptidyl-prolyl cis-trans isomerase|nr:FKBP-type peptidyl-prolyl cis-trans isomerase [Candidatus Acidoferrum sp.]